MNKMWRKTLGGLLLLLMALGLGTPALAAEDEMVYTLVDESGQMLTMRAGRMYVDDEYIAGDNRQYRIVEVDDINRVARGAYLGMSTVDERALSVFYAYAATEVDENAGDRKKLICMYSTHSDECYVPSDGESSKWEDAGIYDVGNQLKKALEKRGITAVYSEESFLPHDADAYTRSRSTAEELLKKGPDALLDIHRDAVPASQYETEVDGEDISMVRLFVGRSNQNAAANKAFAREIKQVADEKYPGLIKDIYIGKGNYNQELYPQALLLEFGTHEIEKEKAMGATEYMAEVLEDVLYGPSAKAEESQKTHRVSAATGIAWAVGLVILAAIIYGLVATGSFKGMGQKIRRDFTEVTGGLFGKKKK